VIKEYERGGSGIGKGREGYLKNGELFFFFPLLPVKKKEKEIRGRSRKVW
jgi:hypothetical protein